MKAIEYNTIDKSSWQYGQNEPDKKQWQHESGLACLIVRSDLGALCGYVGVPANHAYYEKDYYDIENIEAHGGLTFSGKCHESDDPAKGICHIGEEVWWLGFDCAHAWDIIPNFSVTELLDERFSPWGRVTYKDFEYVMEEVNRLADQLKAAA